MSQAKLPDPVLDAPQVTQVREVAMGGAWETANRPGGSSSLERWRPHMGTTDQLIQRVKPLADARTKDITRTDGYAAGARQTMKDSVVGGHYRLNATPVTSVLKTSGYKFDDVWETEFQEIVEARFDLIAESEEGFLDASGVNTLTGLIRMAVGGYMLGGEVLSVAAWLNKDRNRPLKTALQPVASARLSNPNNGPNTDRLTNGIAHDLNGKPLGYWIRKGHPYSGLVTRDYEWEYVEARKPWGRQQVIHIIEQEEPDQKRGIAAMVAALEHMRMTQNLSRITLQNAVVQASYAAAIETELPPAEVYGMMGGDSGPENFDLTMGAMLSMVGSYFGAAENISIDGAKVPVLPPGTKLNTHTLGTPGGVGDDFGKSLLRHTAAALGMSYEEFSRDFTNLSYAGGKLAVGMTSKGMASKKKMVADRYANAAFALVLEEEIAAGNVPLPRGVTRQLFYKPLMKQAFCKATWLGASAGQIDELKETQAALLRIKSGLSSWSIESARLGYDVREVYKQQQKERAWQKDMELDFNLDGSKPGNKDPQSSMQDNTSTEDKQDPTE